MNFSVQNIVLDYHPFGSTMPGRTFVPENKYRFGFQGQEEDDETNLVNYKFRMHDSRLGRFISIDPLASKYSYNSPYAFQENKLGLGIELEGAELLPFHSSIYQMRYNGRHQTVSIARENIPPRMVASNGLIITKWGPVGTDGKDQTFNVPTLVSGNYYNRSLDKDFQLASINLTADDATPESLSGSKTPNYLDKGANAIAAFQHGKAMTENQYYAWTIWADQAQEFKNRTMFYRATNIINLLKNSEQQTKTNLTNYVLDGTLPDFDKTKKVMSFNKTTGKYFYKEVGYYSDEMKDYVNKITDIGNKVLEAIDINVQQKTKNQNNNLDCKICRKGG